jgi:cell division protein FtsI (penicillin-binding protein 3)
MRRLMRLVVTDGFGKTAEVPGYYPGGKTGTAEKVGGKGGYKKHTNVAAFMSVFPMQAPRFAVYMMLDEPKANASTHGYATAGWVAAPAAGRVIGRIGPMLGLLPDVENAAVINQALYMPLTPPHGYTIHAVQLPGPAQAPLTATSQVAPFVATPKPPMVASSGKRGGKHGVGPTEGQPVDQSTPASSSPGVSAPPARPARDPRHEAAKPPGLIGASVYPAIVTQSSAGAPPIAPR